MKTASHLMGRTMFFKDKLVPKPIAFDESYIREIYEEAGFSISDPVHDGSWCSRDKAVSFQDIIVAQRP